MFSCEYYEISNNIYFKERLRKAACEVTLGSDCLGLSLWTVIFKIILILQKYQSLSNQSFKHNLALMPSLNLTPTLSFESRFRLFIINGYEKKQALVVLGLLVGLALQICLATVEGINSLVYLILDLLYLSMSFFPLHSRGYHLSFNFIWFGLLFEFEKTTRVWRLKRSCKPFGIVLKFKVSR